MLFLLLPSIRLGALYRYQAIPFFGHAFAFFQGRQWPLDGCLVWLYFTDDCYEWISGVEMPIGATQGALIWRADKAQVLLAPVAHLETG